MFEKQAQELDRIAYVDMDHARQKGSCMSVRNAAVDVSQGNKRLRY